MEAPHITRMREERVELVARHDKLADFTLTQTFDDLEGPEQALLIQQLASMAGYLTTLTVRIRRATR